MRLGTILANGSYHVAQAASSHVRKNVGARSHALASVATCLRDSVRRSASEFAQRTHEALRALEQVTLSRDHRPWRPCWPARPSTCV